MILTNLRPGERRTVLVLAFSTVMAIVFTDPAAWWFRGPVAAGVLLLWLAIVARVSTRPLPKDPTNNALIRLGHAIQLREPLTFLCSTQGCGRPWIVSAPSSLVELATCDHMALRVGMTAVVRQVSAPMDDTQGATTVVVEWPGETAAAKTIRATMHVQMQT
jgi:hypothetical protein